MKRNFLKILAFVFLLALLGTGCEKDEESCVDWSTKKFQASIPGFCIYKTANDYFEYANVGISNGEIIYCPSYQFNSFVFCNSDTIYPSRCKLRDGYVLSLDANMKDAYLDIKIKDYFKWQINNKLPTMPNDLLLTHIAEEDPYTELWFVKISNMEFSLEDLNQLIKEKNLQLYFTKLK